MARQSESTPDFRTSRRAFLAAGLGAAAATACARRTWAASPAGLQAGEGVVDISPPLGIEMGGFHRTAGKERRIVGIRQAPHVRALCLAHGNVRVAIIAMEILGVSAEMTRRVQQAVAARTGIPAENVRLCATHTHSMPTFVYCRQWGAISAEYQAAVEQKAVAAVAQAVADLAPAQAYLGQARVKGGNFNRTTPKFQTDEHFDARSTDATRWLDTTLHVLRLARSGRRPDLAWYHFSCHPVCYTDDQAGPDWPGLVAQRLAAKRNLRVAFLQGHAGDVNPGSGKPWLGVPEEVADRVADGLCQALDASQRIPVDTLRVKQADCRLPLDMACFRQWLAEYPKLEAKAQRGRWVDAPFAADWFRSAAQWDQRKDRLAIPLSALQLGELGMLFHPAELYSYYGLAIRRDSPFANTLAVGYTDHLIGYLPDPAAYAAGEYAALVVPKIVDLPPFVPTAAREMTTAAAALLRRLAG